MQMHGNSYQFNAAMDLEVDSLSNRRCKLHSRPWAAQRKMC